MVKPATTGAQTQVTVGGQSVPRPTEFAANFPAAVEDDRMPTGATDH